MRLSALAMLFFLLPLSAYAGPAEFTYSFTLQPGSYSSTWGPGPVYLNVQVAADGTGFSIDHGNGSAGFTGMLSGGGTAAPFDPYNPVPSAVIPIGQFAFGPGALPLSVDFGFMTNLLGTLKITDTDSGESAELDVPISVTGSTSGGYWFDAAGPGVPGVPLGGHYYGVGAPPSQEVGPDGGAVSLNVFLDYYEPQEWNETPDGGPTEGETAGSPTPAEAPEPSALLLVGIGLVSLSRAAWRTRRRQ